MRRSLLPVMFALTLSACASIGKQTREVLKAPPEGLPAVATVESVPFVRQEAGHCGPATLAMAMRWAGEDAPVEQLVREIYTPGAKGSFQTDMLSAARRHGLMAVAVDSLPALLSEIAAGNPVVVFENLGLSWYPTWHYAVALGYDLGAQEMILHSGPTAFERVDMTRFEHAWSLGKYWAIVVLPANRLSASAGEVAHLRAAAGLEQAGRAEAGAAYARILERWPRSLGALVGLANIAYNAGESARAASYLRQAVEYHPESKTARHNLEVAEEASRR